MLLRIFSSTMLIFHEFVRLVLSFLQILYDCLRFLWSHLDRSIFSHVAISDNPAVSADEKIIPLSVNYQLTRQCNYKCGFCFHTSLTSYVLPIEKAKEGLAMLKSSGMKKVNFAGGEPFIHERGNYLGELVVYSKAELKVESVSIISNGSLITKSWLEKYSKYLDILAVSCDSFDKEINTKIGRYQNSRTDHIGQIYKIRDWCCQYGIIFKMNTVVNTYNLDEDMCEHLKELNPARWKVFQCLLIEGENCGPDALRNGEEFYVTDEQFSYFLKRHSSIGCLVPEDNNNMKDSYLLLDEYMRFLNCQNNKKEPSKSILDVGVENALKFSGFDEEAFLRRGGVYKWSKPSSLEW